LYEEKVAFFVFEQTFTTQRVHHGYLEPHAAMVAIDSSERILVWCPAKGPYATRQQLGEWLGLEEAKIVFQLSPVGGDFGGKGSLMDIPICYNLARVTGRPVKMVMDYSEELMAANPRHPSMITIKTGVKKDGRLWAREVKAIFNSGAYAGLKNNETVNLPGARHGAGAYYIPHVKIDAFSVYTNCVPSGIMRGPGEAQMLFTVESHTDHIAREMGMDPYEFRVLNVLKRGDLLPYGIRLQDDKGKQLLKRMAANFKWDAAKPKRPYVGRGLALCVREIGVGEANVEVGVKSDGRVYILTTIARSGSVLIRFIAWLMARRKRTIWSGLDLILSRVVLRRRAGISGRRRPTSTITLYPFWVRTSCC
jgi:CO/xanthine dehydrogenase Mo-binding subunit